MTHAPYLLYIGQATDLLSAKTARGLAVWRPEQCIGQVRSNPDGVTLSLPDMTIAEGAAAGAKTFVLGTANAGGIMAEETAAAVLEALESGMDIASGLHQRLRDQPAIRERAETLGRNLWDVREPPKHLKVGNGIPRAGKRLLTVGTDCSVGKMYTTLALEKTMQARGVNADFRATGQTGILIAGAGIPIDAVVSDFISGAVEQLSPVREDGGWDLIEGQGSLFHPSYAGVSLGLLHGAQPDAIVLCHESGREMMRHMKHHPVPDLKLCLDRNLEAARLTNADVVAVGISLNTSALDDGAARDACAAAADALGLPCVDPVRHGVDAIVDRWAECFDK